MSTSRAELVRGLNLRDTTALVVGTIIGTGVFLKTAKMANAVGSPTLVLLVWVAAGLLSLAGALAYAELGAMMPEAGGEFVYLKTAYGRLPAFLFGWMRIVIGSTGSIASFGVAFAIFVSAFLPKEWMEPWTDVKKIHIFSETIEWQLGPQQFLAVGLILTFSALNCLKVVFGGRIQSVLTCGKVIGIISIVVGVFFFADAGSWEHLKSPVPAKTFASFGALASAFGVAMIGALWAYDGWNNMPMVAGEVKNPGKNVPLALMFGMAIVLVIYGLTNVAYFYALPFEEVKSATTSFKGTPVVTKAAMAFWPAHGAKLVSVAVLLSVIGVINGSILTSARVPYAMAKQGLFFPIFARLNEKQAVPVAAIIMQGIWASILALSATFDQLTDGVVFASMIFYASCCLAVIVLRKKMPNAPRPYRTLGYPIVPIMFVLVAGWLLVDSVINNTVFSVAALLLILAGLPIYFYLGKKPVATGSPSQKPNVTV
ncbi:MAG: Amino acid transporter [Verrucomicrobiales bacterium]|nr:Amino acid transporter [Verrucomicrobiales bacterium]